jgi:hypothetical protein
LAWPSNKV